MKKSFTIALAGNPNCGKTTIFNLLTGTHQHVGNYSGVTVERKTGYFKIDRLNIRLVDLPGIYSLSSASAEEKVAFRELTCGEVDLILNIIDAGNIQRNLYLTTQLTELGIPMMLVFNMSDDVHKRGMTINYDMIGHYFNAPYVEAVGSRGIGVEGIMHMIEANIRATKRMIPKPLDYGTVVSEAVNAITDELSDRRIFRNSHIPNRCAAIRLLEGDEDVCAMPESQSVIASVEKWRKKIHSHHGLSSETFMTDCRYGMIAGTCREAISFNNEPRHQFSEDIDRVVTNKYLGLPIFFIMMFLAFFLTFTCAEPFTNILGWCFGELAGLVNSIWPAGKYEFMRSLVTEGVIGGVGGVLQFIPNILFLFLAIAFLEGTGYMARAAFVMDGFMHRFGLHGKSFIPMLLGFGCTVPAIMACRTIDTERDRIVTIMVLPLMSCGARLPIYSLMIPAFFPHGSQSLMMWLIYFIGIILAFAAAGVMKSTFFKSDDEIFVMELPPYRMPTVRSLLLYMLERAVMYLRKAGTFILAASVIMFICNTVPGPGAASVEEMTLRAERSVSAAEYDTPEARGEALRAHIDGEKLENSISGWVGKKMEIVFRPLGFDWKVCSALIGAFAGKELFVSQMGILNSISETQEHDSEIANAKKAAAGEDRGLTMLQAAMKRDYNPLKGFCIMLFCLISMPCIATFAVVRKETGWKWAVGQICGLTLLAYAVTFAVYQIGLHI